MYHELLHTKNSPLHALEFKTSLILFGNIPKPPPRVTLIWSIISLNNLVVISFAVPVEAVCVLLLIKWCQYNFFEVMYLIIKTRSELDFEERDSIAAPCAEFEHIRCFLNKILLTVISESIGD